MRRFISICLIGLLGLLGWLISVSAGVQVVKGHEHAGQMLWIGAFLIACSIWMAVREARYDL